MTAMERVEVIWSGAVGLPGVSVFYGDTTVPSLNSDLFTFFDSIKALVPSGVQISIPNSGDLIEDSDGSLAGSWSSSGGGVVTATGSGGYPASVGMAVVWNTNGIRGSRRVRGRTFLCPLVNLCFDTNGTIETTRLAVVQNAATVLASAGNLRVWSRPSLALGAGTSHSVLNASVPDRVTALRSRRF